MELDAQELSDFYDFFKKAEHLLARQTGSHEDYKLCRALKWQFRAASSEQKHQQLTETMSAALGYINTAGVRSNHRHIGYEYQLIPSRQLSAGPYLANDSHLGLTADMRLQDTRINSLLLKVKSTFPNVSKHKSTLGIGLLTSREYKSLKAYVETNSHSLSARASESRTSAAKYFTQITSVSNHLERNRLYANLSQSFVKESLAVNGLGDIAFSSFGSTPEAVEKQRGMVLSCGTRTAIECFEFLNFNTDIALNLTLAKKYRAMDIVDLYDRYPAMAERKLNARQHAGDDSAQLLRDMQQHRLSSSRRFTHQACLPVLPSELNDTLHEINRQSQALLERYVVRKLRSGVDEPTDKKLRELMAKNHDLLRPPALKTFTSSTHTRTATATARADLSDTAQASPGKGITIHFIHRHEDDPHLSGDYLEIHIDEVDAAKALKKALGCVLSGIGQQNFSWENLIGSITDSVLGTPNRRSSNILVKIKDHQPVILRTLHMTSKHSTVRLPEMASQLIDVEIESTRIKRHIQNEQLGCDSLDFILPIAYQLLGGDHGNRAWDTYVNAHENDIKALLDNIAEQNHGAVLTGEIETIRRINPQLCRDVEALLQQAKKAQDSPQDGHHAQAKIAFKHMLQTYLDTYYKAKVSEAWKLS
ncbi:hypothetical protein OOJ96_14850 [Pseudomonas sp. 15FMM2]|uniref:Uncharacterized protein n=1 Tax=Pseudomonas imrae TaxID=2992837 RepID=A0ACC7PE99_9PSED